MEIEVKLDKSKLRKKGHPIILSIFVTKTDRQYPVTGYYAFSEQWDDVKKLPKKSHPMYYGLSEFIHNVKIKINKLLERRKYMTSEQIKNFIFDDNPESLILFWEKYVEELRNNGKAGNAKFYNCGLQALKEYKKDVLFNDVTYDFLIKHRDFHLSKKKKNGEQKVSNNGVILYLRAFKTVFKEAKKRKVYIPDDSSDPFEGVKPKPLPTKDKYFSIDEMKKIINAEDKHELYDIFILCFLLGGIDYVDLSNLKYEHIRDGRVKFHRFKGGTNEMIDNFIFPEAQSILDKYKDGTGFLVPLHKFEKESSSFLTNYMRKIRRWFLKLGIQSYFTSKTPRYTFIDIGKQLLLSRDVIMELTGHSHGDVHSIYEGRYPNYIKDEVHRKIIDSVFVDL